jgi:hypothetical protein
MSHINTIENILPSLNEVILSFLSKFNPELSSEWSAPAQQALLREALSHKLPDQPAPKKKRTAKDPNAPKRAKSAYLFFCEHMRPLLKERGIKPGKETMVALGEEWGKVSVEDRAPYAEMAQEDKNRYAQQIAVAPDEHSDDSPDGSLVDSPDGSPVEKKARAPRKPKDPNAPKRPRSAYLFFCEHMRPILKGQGAKMPGALGKAWTALKDSSEDEDKERLLVYQRQAAAEKAVVVPVSEDDGLDKLKLTELRKICITKTILFQGLKKAELLAHMRAVAAETGISFV